MALQPFVGPRPLLQFRNLFYTDGRIPWTSDQPVAWTLPTHRINVHTDNHALSGIRTHDPSVRASEDSSCLRPRNYCDRRSRSIISQNLCRDTQEKKLSTPVSSPKAESDASRGRNIIAMMMRLVY
jgi:hypothetical protein